MEIFYEEHFPLISRIGNCAWKAAAVSVWDQYFRACKWPGIERAMLNINPAKGTLANYVRAVMELSWQSAVTLQKIYGISVDMDILLLSAFLHDACKLLEYEPAEDGYVKSYIGEIYQHGFLSAHDALARGLPDAVVSNIICHTPQSNHPICTIEGQILAHSDRMVTSSLEMASRLAQ